MSQEKKPEKMAKQSISHKIDSLWLNMSEKQVWHGLTLPELNWGVIITPGLQGIPLGGCGRPQAQRSCLQRAAKQKQEDWTLYLKDVCIVKKMTHIKYSIVLTRSRRFPLFVSISHNFQFLSLKTTAPGPTLTKFSFWRPSSFQKHNLGLNAFAYVKKHLWRQHLCKAQAIMATSSGSIGNIKESIWINLD